jgi:hypothetical protein
LKFTIIKKFKFIMKNVCCLVVFVFCLLTCFISCNGNKSDSGSVYNPKAPVVLSSFYPDSGRIAEKVILQGENFGSDPKLIKVYFNYKPAAVVGSDGTNMYVVVPRMPGDTCTVSVVIGTDSVVYSKKFLYKVSVTVSTVTGNGQVTFREGTLATAQLRARYLCMDNENNLFAIQRSDGLDGLIRINEEENIVALIQSNMAVPNALCVDKVYGIVTAPADDPTNVFYNADPREGWAVRTRNLRFTDGTGNQIEGTSGRYKHAMAACEWDGYIYTRFRSGHIVKINPKTYEAQCITKNASGAPYACTTFGDVYGLAFHPLHPQILYMAFTGECGDMAHALYSIAVSAPDPATTLTRLSGPGTSGGFRDGKLSDAKFNNPRQIYFDPDAYLYIADYDNHCIRRVTPENIVETVVGIPGTSGYKDGNKDEALFNHPWGLAVSKEGNVYVADWDNSRVRKLAVE